MFGEPGWDSKSETMSSGATTQQEGSEYDSREQLWTAPSYDSAYLVREHLTEQLMARGDTLLHSSSRSQQLNEFNLQQHRVGVQAMLQQPMSSNSRYFTYQTDVLQQHDIGLGPQQPPGPDAAVAGNWTFVPNTPLVQQHYHHHHHHQQQQHHHQQQPRRVVEVRPINTKKTRQTTFSDSVQLDIYALEDTSFEDIIVKSCRSILGEAPRNTLKAVELANFLRARVGSDVLARIREKWGGLLLLLEQHQTRFRVERIPKSDIVSLVVSSDSLAASACTTSSVGTQKNSSGASQKQQLVWVATNNATTDDFPGSNSASANNSGAGTGGLGNFNSQGIVLDADSRSMHLFVGNISPHWTDEQIANEFSRYGEIEQVSGIRQNGIYGALIKFATIEQSVAAMQRLSKLSQFLGQVMYAHFATSQRHHMASATPSSKQQLQLPQPPQITPPVFVPAQRPSLLSSNRVEEQLHNSSRGQGPPMLTIASQPFVPHNSTGLPPPGFHGNSYSMNALDSFPPSTRERNHSGILSDLPHPVINRLTDGMFSFTDQWSVDPVLDAPYIALIVSELQNEKCVSLLHIATIIPNQTGREINTIALKAMCMCYPQSLQVRGNQTALPHVDMTVTRVSAWF